MQQEQSVSNPGVPNIPVGDTIIPPVVRDAIAPHSANMNSDSEGHFPEHSHIPLPDLGFQIPELANSVQPSDNIQIPVPAGNAQSESPRLGERIQEPSIDAQRPESNAPVESSSHGESIQEPSNDAQRPESNAPAESSSPGGSSGLPQRFFEPGSYPPDGRVNSFSKPEYLIDIVEVLHGSKELELIKNNGFGGLFDLPIRKSSMSGKIVHNLLVRQLYTKKKHEMWFVFGGRPLRFSLREFKILTGLPCGIFPDVGELDKFKSPPEGAEPYWNKLIGKGADPTIAEIVQWLKVKPRMSADRKLRLALLVIVEGILLTGASPVKPSFEVVEMLRDLDFFFSYPWGRRSFQRTVEMILIGEVVGIDELYSKLIQSHILIHGFPLSLQLLLFEVVPMLTSYLPNSDDERTFSDRSILHLTQLRRFHNCTIEDTENDAQLTVDSILHTSEELDREVLQWEDDESDAQVDRIIDLLKVEHAFTEEEWAAAGIVRDGVSMMASDDVVTGNSKKVVGARGRGKSARPARGNKGKEKVDGGLSEESAAIRDDLVMKHITKLHKESLKIMKEMIAEESEKWANVILSRLLSEFPKEARDQGFAGLSNRIPRGGKAKPNALREGVIPVPPIESPASPTPSDQEHAQLQEVRPYAVSRKKRKRDGGMSKVNRQTKKQVRPKVVCSSPSADSEHVKANVQLQSESPTRVTRSRKARLDKSKKREPPESHQVKKNVKAKRTSERLSSPQSPVGKCDWTAPSWDNYEMVAGVLSSMSAEGHFGAKSVGVSVDSEDDDREPETQEETHVVDDVEDMREEHAKGKPEVANGLELEAKDGVADAQEPGGVASVATKEVGPSESNVRKEDDNFQDQTVGENGKDSEDHPGAADVQEPGAKDSVDLKGEHSADPFQQDVPVELPPWSTVLIAAENGVLEFAKNHGPDDVPENALDDGKFDGKDDGKDAEKDDGMESETLLTPQTGAIINFQEGDKDVGSDNSILPCRNTRYRSMHSIETRGGKRVECEKGGSPWLVDPQRNAMFIKALNKTKESAILINNLYVTRSFFTIISTPQRWTSNSHLEPIMTVLWRRNCSRLLEMKIAFLDSCLPGFLVSNFGDWNKAIKKKVRFMWPPTLRNFALGIAANRYAPLAWYVNTTRIYSLMNWGKKHWVALHIDLISRTVEVFDPLISETSDTKMKKTMDPIVKMLPYLIKDFCSTQKQLLPEFSLIRKPAVYQNERTGDCGPLSCKFIELHSSGAEDLEDLNEEMVDNMRLAYAIDVFEEFAHPLSA